jgi:nucleotide-binding universal stress UspA family protein
MLTSSSSREPFRLVVGFKPTDSGKHAFEEAARIARRIPECAVHLVHVAGGAPTEAKLIELAEHLRLYTEEMAQALGGMPGVTMSVHVRHGDVAPELATFANELSADMILLGSNRRHLRTLYASPTADKIASQSPLPIVVAGPRPRAEAKTEPEIEPPCVDCVQVRFESGGTTWWCARHSHHHGIRPHTYSYDRQIPLATHDSAVSPTGVDMR